MPPLEEVRRLVVEECVGGVLHVYEGETGPMVGYCFRTIEADCYDDDQLHISAPTKADAVDVLTAVAR